MYGQDMQGGECDKTLLDRVDKYNCAQTHTRASELCEAAGGWLATPRTRDEQIQFNALLTPSAAAAAWIGATNADDIAKWVTKWGPHDVHGVHRRAHPSLGRVLQPGEPRGGQSEGA